MCLWCLLHDVYLVRIIIHLAYTFLFSFARVVSEFKPCSQSHTFGQCKINETKKPQTCRINILNILYFLFVSSCSLAHFATFSSLVRKCTLRVYMKSNIHFSYNMTPFHNLINTTKVMIVKHTHRNISISL